MSVRSRTGGARALLTALTLATGAWPAAGRAYRPFDSTDAAVAGHGEVEVELGPVGLARVGAERSLVAPSLVLNWGFRHGLEGVLEGRQVFDVGRDAGGSHYRLEDTALSLKGVLREGCLQEQGGPSVATEVGLLLPAVHAEPGVGAQGTLILSQRWDALTVHANGQVAWTRAHTAGLMGGLVLEGPDRWPLRPVAEVVAEGERGGGRTRSALLGAIWRAREGLSVDAAVKLARTGAEDVVELRAGLTWAYLLGSRRR